MEMSHAVEASVQSQVEQQEASLVGCEGQQAGEASDQEKPCLWCVV